MARNVLWRRSCPDIVSSRQKEAFRSTIYIVREMGPTGFLLKEESEQIINKVLIGDVHSCSCLTFMKNNKSELCKHICWILIKKFKLSLNDPLSWQLGLCEREVSDLLKCSRTSNIDNSHQNQEISADQSTDPPMNVVKQRIITAEDTCPICQEDFSNETQRITYCRFGCGNSVHTKCMMIWAAHRKADSIVECPFCRTDFGPITLLGEETMRALIDRKKFRAGQLEHRGMFCCACGICPIVGKCYKCDRCISEDFCLCSNCFKTEIHNEHPFVYRMRTNNKWTQVTNRNLLLSFGLARLKNITTREITEDDYEMLLQLDESQQNTAPPINIIQECHLKMLPSKRLNDSNKLLVDVDGCKICSKAFQEGQEVKQIPCCKKWLHRMCLEVWLLHWSQLCPFEGVELTEKTFANFHEARREKLTRNQSRTKSRNCYGDGADISIHGSNVGPPYVEAPASAWSSQPWYSSSKHQPQDFVRGSFGKKVRRSSTTMRYPRQLPPLPSSHLHLPSLDIRQVDIREPRVKDRAGLNAPKSSESQGHSKSAPFAKREHSWPLLTNHKSHRILLEPIRTKKIDNLQMLSEDAKIATTQE